MNTTELIVEMRPEKKFRFWLVNASLWPIRPNERFPTFNTIGKENGTPLPPPKEAITNIIRSWSKKNFRTAPYYCKTICFPNGNVLFLSLFSLSKNWMHNIGWGCAGILPDLQNGSWNFIVEWSESYFLKCCCCFFFKYKTKHWYVPENCSVIGY